MTLNSTVVLHLEEMTTPSRLQTNGGNYVRDDKQRLEKRISVGQAPSVATTGPGGASDTGRDTAVPAGPWVPGRKLEFESKTEAPSRASRSRNEAREKFKLKIQVQVPSLSHDGTNTRDSFTLFCRSRRS